MMEKFEQWAEDQGYSLARRPNGDYVSQHTLDAMNIWQARQPEIDAKDKVIDGLALQKGMLKAEIGRLTDENAALKAEMSIPEGWPTEGMVTAGINAQGTADHLLDEFAERSDMAGAFKAMLAAAPTPPAQEQVELPKLVAYPSTLIPKEQWRNEPIDYWLRKMLENCDYHDGLVIKATLAFLARLNTPATEVEPIGVPELIDTVGERVKELLRNDFKSLVSEMNFAREILERDDGLRRAARWAVKQHQTSGGLVGLAMENLRAELNKDKS